MRKLYTVFALLILGFASRAQVIPGGDMETWRTGTAHYASSASRTINAPANWCGFDSLVIYEGEYVASLPLVGFGNGNDYWPQVFSDSTLFHGGAKSAKLITIKQDTLGKIGGAIGNYQTDVTLNLTAGTYTYFIHGGTPITGRIHSASAWVQYKYHPNGAILDTAQFKVSAHKHFGTVDSAIGTGSVNIDSTSGSWVQVTAYLFYNDAVTIPDTIRFTFTSSISGAIDSSILHVDDVTMTNIGLGVDNNSITGEPLKIFPNPASGMVNIQSVSGIPVKMELYSISGQLVADAVITSQETLDVSTLPAGLYFYNVCSTNGEILQKGKLEVMH